MFIGFAAIVIAYLLGSVPTAYITARFLKGKDIRKLGGGNAGALNVYREVNKVAGVAVGILDMVKGAAAVLITVWLLQIARVEPGSVFYLFTMSAGLAAVAGHIWPVFLRFDGGNGLATTIGVLAVLMTMELLIAVAFALLFLVITRNLILSTNISLLLFVPASAWMMGRSPLFIVFPLILAVILIINFLPTAKAALVKAGSKANLGAELIRHNRRNK
jgi:glycerol-3-phosphate acyltransferase PlsY